MNCRRINVPYSAKPSAYKNYDSAHTKTAAVTAVFIVILIMNYVTVLL